MTLPTVFERTQRIQTLFSAVSQTIPTSNRDFNLFAIDTTPCPRPFAQTLADKTFIHYPNVSFTTKKGRQLTVTISGWKQMLMRGNKNYKMNNYPFTLLQIVVRDREENTIWKPMWLIVIGSRRDELSLIDCYQSYRQRYDERPQRGFLAMGTREC